MKLINKTLLLLTASATILASCNKFDDLNTNPDAATKVTAPMLATKLILNITQQGSAKNFVYHSMLSKQIAWSENASDEQYNLFGRTDFDGYTILTNCQKMVDAANEGDKDSYAALAKFMKAYKLFYKSLEVGDIPYSDALKGEEGVQKPKYDTQKEVMRQVLEDLEEAYTLFSSGSDFDGDPIFGGDTENWKKTVVAFELKVLTHLCKKDTKFNDYRMFYYASPAKAQTDKGIKDSEWDAYLSIDPSDSYSNISVLYGKGEFCLANLRYTRVPEGEPLMRLSYAEQNFILAEGAVRGWISEDASTYYKKGIEASMNFIADNTPDKEEYTHGRTITQEYIQEYLAQPVIQLSGDKEKDLEMILLQRYLASFLQHPYDAYYDYRRTGYPVLPINPNTNLNTEKNKIPTRWMYPEAEFSYNPDNANEAVQRQYNGSDDVNKLMWILQ